MKIEMTASETARYWRERRQRIAKRVKALEARGDWLTTEIEKHQEVRVVVEPDYIATDRNYSQVHSYYKFGCRTCSSREYTPSMCANCIELSKEVDTTGLFAIAKAIYERDNPPLETDTDMKEILKRGLPAGTTLTDENTQDGAAGKKVKVGNNV